MKHPNPDMILRIAQGDAYAAAVEYLGDSPVATLHRQEVLKFERYLKHPLRRGSGGWYTDDAQMSIAVAEVLLGDDHSTGAFVDAFFSVFKRDPRKGYSRGFQDLLEKSKTPQELVASLNGNSDKNGAAMRAVPIGVLPGTSEVMKVARVQAKITHNSEGGILSAMMVALMSHFALYTDEPFSNLPSYLEATLSRKFPFPWSGPVVWTEAGVGLNTAYAVLTLLATETTLLGIMRKLIEWGGDTDTVAAIAWGIASARYREELPEFFEHTLEPGQKYGPAFLKSLGTQLMEKHSK